MIQLPKILNIPPKLIPVITEFNNYSRFLLEGGRGGGKSQSIARVLLWIAEQRKVTIVCGRELQVTIADSVKKIFDDLINEFKLNFKTTDKEIIHNVTGSTFKFKGFREQGRVSIKGLEGVDILWIDEAEAIQKATLDIITPTIRKAKSKIIFTMNRNVRGDAVYNYCLNRDDCLHIKINYYDNPHCTDVLKKEAEICKKNNPIDYNHIWLGNPKEQDKDFLISATKLDASKNLNPSNEAMKLHSVLTIDLAGSGGDSNVAKLIKQVNSITWVDAITLDWHEPDTDVTKGKIISYISQYKPDVVILDSDGVGYSIACSIKNIFENTILFRGAGKVKDPKSSAINARAEGYLEVRNFINNNWLKITHDKTLKQLEYLKLKYKHNGSIVIESKDEIRKEQGESPDYADSLMMGIYAIAHHSYLFTENEQVFVKSEFNPFD